MLIIVRNFSLLRGNLKDWATNWKESATDTICAPPQGPSDIFYFPLKVGRGGRETGLIQTN